MSERSGTEWHNDLVRAVTRMLGRDHGESGADHALDVERMAQQILQEPEYAAGLAMDEEALIAGALLHEVGLGHRKHHWSDDDLEHLGEGAGLATQVLRNNEAFEGRPDRVERVLGLIAHHDDTVRAFPSKRRDGALTRANGPDGTEGIERELAVLREAEGRVHIGAGEIAASIRVWQEGGVPFFAERGPRLTSWMWHECVAGNIRLSVKRAVVDARTQAGAEYCLEAYDRLERVIKEECRHEGVPYEQEICAPALRRGSLTRMRGRSFSLRFIAFHGWGSLEEELRSCVLRDDKSIRPYEKAGLRTEKMEIEALTPLALYVLEKRLDEVLELHDALMVQYCLGLWDLPGWMEFSYNDPARQVIAPPIVEEYVEEMAFSGPTLVAGLVDGLHRCVAARSMGVGCIRVLVAAGVPYPIVPLPAAWGDVQVVRKRKYRYSSLEEFPDVSGFSSVGVDEKNFQYFFYRDLSRLGSRGERTFHEFDELRAD